MTNSARIKSESEATVLALGGRINRALPVLDPSEFDIRSSHDIARRAAILSMMVQLSFGAPLKLVSGWLARHSLVGLLSPEERLVVVAEADPDEATKRRLRWNIEALWASVWVGGLVGELGPTSPIGDQLAGLVPDLRTNEPPDRLFEAFRMRDDYELLKTLDLFYRAHWAAVNARLSGVADCPFNEGVVYERRRLLEWSLNASVEWEDVEMGT